jgi:hypothetical protein
MLLLMWTLNSKEKNQSASSTMWSRGLTIRHRLQSMRAHQGAPTTVNKYTALHVSIEIVSKMWSGDLQYARDCKTIKHLKGRQQR